MDEDRIRIPTMKLLLTGIFSLATLNANGDNPILMKATESSIIFEDGTRISMKRDKIGDLGSVEVTLEGKNIKIAKADFGQIPDPLINSVNLTHPSPDRWELTVSYAYGQRWAWTSCELTICFGKGGYIEKTLKIPTGKDIWIYKRQKAGMPEEDVAHGGRIPGTE